MTIRIPHGRLEYLTFSTESAPACRLHSAILRKGRSVRTSAGRITAMKRRKDPATGWCMCLSHLIKGRYETCGAALIRGRGSRHTPWGLGRAGARTREVVRRGAGRRAALGPPVPAAALGAHRGSAASDAIGRDAVEGAGTGLLAGA